MCSAVSCAMRVATTTIALSSAKLMFAAPIESHMSLFMAHHRSGTRTDLYGKRAVILYDSVPSSLSYIKDKSSLEPVFFVRALRMFPQPGEIKALSTLNVFFLSAISSRRSSIVLFRSLPFAANGETDWYYDGFFGDLSPFCSLRLSGNILSSKHFWNIGAKISGFFRISHIRIHKSFIIICSYIRYTKT